MEISLKILKKLYQDLGINPEIGDLPKRLVLQKTAFLAKYAGAPISHNFNWYVKGPYSPSLASSYYELQDYLEEDVEDLSFDEDVRDRIASLKEVIHKKNSNNSVNPDWVEALASIAFLVNDSKKTIEEAIQILAVKKSHIETDMVQEAIAELEKISYLH